jgi:hypothetical protein
LSDDVQEFIYEKLEIDTHTIWEMFREEHKKPKWIDQEKTMEMAFEESSKSSFNIIESQVSFPKQGQGQRSEEPLPLQGPVRLVLPTGQTCASRGTNTCLMAKKKKKKRTEGGKIEKNEASNFLAKELEALKSENASLICKYDSLVGNMIRFSNPLLV